MERKPGSALSIFNGTGGNIVRLSTLLERFLEIPLVYRLHSSMVDEAKQSAILAVHKDYTGLRVLDIGCGPGNNTGLFQGSLYTGIDINPRYIERASALHPNADFLAGDAVDLTLRGEFDVVLMNSLLHHLNDTGVKKVISAAVGVLASEGIIILQEPLIPAPGEGYHRFMMWLDRGDYFRSLEDWCALASVCGLKVVHRDFYSLRVFGIRGYHMVSLVLKAED